MIDIRERLLNEFTNYYQADELPDIIGDGLDDWADDSADRLAAAAGDQAADLAVLLRELAANRACALVEEIENRTCYGWTGSDEEWAVFQHLVTYIADGIDARTAPGRH